MDRAGFEARLTSLRGRRITSVGYWDLSDEPDWDHGDCHLGEMGVELGTDVRVYCETYKNGYNWYYGKAGKKKGWVVSRDFH